MAAQLDENDLPWVQKALVEMTKNTDFIVREVFVIGGIIRAHVADRVIHPGNVSSSDSLYFTIISVNALMSVSKKLESLRRWRESHRRFCQRKEILRLTDDNGRWLYQ